MNGWNFGDILDAISPAVPADEPAFIHGERVITWGEATKATNNMARGADRPRRQARRQDRHLHAQPARVPAGAGRRLQGAADPRQRQLPLHAAKRSGTSSTTPTRRRWSMRRSSATRSAQIRPRLPKVKTWIEVSPDGKVAPFAERVRAAGRGRQRRAARHRALRRRPVLHLHRRHHRHAQGRDVDPQRPARDHPGGRARRMGPVPETLDELTAHTRKTAPACAPCPPRR